MIVAWKRDKSRGSASDWIGMYVGETKKSKDFVKYKWVDSNDAQGTTHFTPSKLGHYVFRYLVYCNKSSPNAEVEKQERSRGIQAIFERDWGKGMYKVVAESEIVKVGPKFKLQWFRPPGSDNIFLKFAIRWAQLFGNKTYTNAWAALYKKGEPAGKGYHSFHWLNYSEKLSNGTLDKIEKNILNFEVEEGADWEIRIFPLRNHYVSVATCAVHLEEESFDEIHKRFAPLPLQVEEEEKEKKGEGKDKHRDEQGIRQSMQAESSAD